MIIQRVPFEQHTKKGVSGTVSTKANRRYIPPVLPAPDTSVSSVHQYRYRTLRSGRYDINTGSGHFGKFSTTSIPVPDTSISSVRHQYRYRTLRYVRYDINTGTGHFRKFGTTSIPVLNTSVSSVRLGYRYRQFGTTSIPVLNTSVSSVRLGYRYRRYRYRLSYRCRTLR